MNCNHPVVMELILDSLRHWYSFYYLKLFCWLLFIMNLYYLSYFLNKWRVTEYHVDGFRFDLASVLCRGTDGSPLDAPPLIKVSLALPGWQEMKISDFIDFSWFLRNCYCFSFFGDFLSVYLLIDARWIGVTA